MLILPSAVFPHNDMEVVVSRMHTAVVPKASPETLPELATYLVPFAPLFRRSTSRASVERYLTGLLTDLPRKNCDTIAAAVAGTSTERLQHLLTDATWDRGSTDGEIFTVIQEGAGPDYKMKGLKGKLSEQDTWHLVNYVRSLSGAQK